MFYWSFECFEGATKVATLRSISLIQSTNFPKIKPKIAIAIAMPIYLIGSCCCANCGGEYGFWNAADVSFFVFISATIRSRKISSCDTKQNKITNIQILEWERIDKLKWYWFLCLLLVACSPVVIDFHHRAIVVPQPKPVRNQMNRVPTTWRTTTNLAVNIDFCFILVS